MNPQKDSSLVSLDDVIRVARDAAEAAVRHHFQAEPPCRWRRLGPRLAAAIEKAAFTCTPGVDIKRLHAAITDQTKNLKRRKPGSSTWRKAQNAIHRESQRLQALQRALGTATTTMTTNKEVR
jgi:hypothetical protein